MFDKCFSKQTTAIHWAAKSLNPETPHAILSFPPNRRREVDAFFRQYVDAADWVSFSDHLRCFHEQDDMFNPDAYLWSLTEDRKGFWWSVCTDCPTLYQMARRLIATPANSVPSERSFSAMNYIQNQFRSRMSTERTDMAIYTFMNSKALARNRAISTARRQCRLEALLRDYASFDEHEEERRRLLEELVPDASQDDAVLAEVVRDITTMSTGLMADESTTDTAAGTTWYNQPLLVETELENFEYNRLLNDCDDDYDVYNDIVIDPDLSLPAQTQYSSVSQFSIPPLPPTGSQYTVNSQLPPHRLFPQSGSQLTLDSQEFNSQTQYSSHTEYSEHFTQSSVIVYPQANGEYTQDSQSLDVIGPGVKRRFDGGEWSQQPAQKRTM